MTQELFYRKSGSGPAVVLLHGFPDSGIIWEPIAATLAMSHTVIVPDLPGTGNSALEGPAMLPQMAAGICNILTKEKITEVVLVGHSMGGYTALAFAALYPQMVRGLSMVHSTPAADDDEKKKTRLKAIDIIRNGGKQAFIKQMTSNLFAENFRKEHPEVLQWKNARGLEVSIEGLENFYRAMIARADNTLLLHQALYPVQWIMGTEDSLIDYRRILKECFHSHVNFVTLYEGCGHMSMLECPDKLTGDLQEFLAYCYHKPSTP